MAAADKGWVLCPLAGDGTPAAEPETVADNRALARVVAAHEANDAPRWVWAATDEIYPALLVAGIRVRRCHDVGLTEGLLLPAEGRYGEPRWLGAALARLRGEPVPAAPVRPARAVQPALFEQRAPAPATDPLAALAEVYADQLRRVDAMARAERFRLLVAAESAGALAAAEMGHDGLPWNTRAHDEVLTELLGPRPAGGARPARLAELAETISAELGQRVNPDSPAQLVRALRAAGLTVSSTRASELRAIDHPVIAPLLEYKELSRLHVAHGWTWRDAWVRDGRFHPEYVVGGVVSGRWATSGGAALQIPKAMRRAVVADPAWRLVVADAAQLEPRILAALAGDAALADAAAHGDLYTAVATDSRVSRDRAKVGLLAAMYGQTSGTAHETLAVMRRRFPVALEYLEAAAHAGERGEIVGSHLGRCCPPPEAYWPQMLGGGQDGGDRTADTTRRRRGRFTRNFVVQATAAEWALTLLAMLRGRLLELAGRAGSDDGAPRLVFFQHDEVIVHTPAEAAAGVAGAVRASADEAGRALFGDTRVRFPMNVETAECYGDVK